MTAALCGLSSLVEQKKLALQQAGMPPADLARLTASVVTEFANGPETSISSYA